MKKVHLLPNIITAFGLSCGLFAIFKTNMIAPGGADYITLQAIAGILLLAALADLLDGAIARAMKAESEFGGLFDSLADAITFGVSPSVIILKSANLSPTSELTFILTTAAMIFSVSGVLRLVRFNMSVQPIRNHFTGLPIPAGAAAMVSWNLLFVSPQFNRWITLSDPSRAWVSTIILLLLGYLMVSRWRFPSFKTLQMRVASFQLIFFTVLSAVFIFYGILYHFPVVFFLVSWTYILIGFTLSLTRRLTGRKELVDFEPASDEIDK